MKLQGEYVLTEIGDEIVACSVGEDNAPRVVVLNETGAALWRMLEKGCTEESLVSGLCEEYEVTEAEAKKDAAAFIEYLKSHGVL